MDNTRVKICFDIENLIEIQIVTKPLENSKANKLIEKVDTDVYRDKWTGFNRVLYEFCEDPILLRLVQSSKGYMIRQTYRFN